MPNPADDGGDGGGADEPREPRSFDELVVFVNRATSHMFRMLEELTLDADSALGPNARRAAVGARVAIGRRRSEVIEAIRSGVYDDALAEHGLSDQDPEWDFKYGVFRDGLDDFDDADTEAHESPGDKKPKKWWKRGSWVLKKINVIFRSIAAAIPGGAAPLTELKDALESVVEIEAGETPE